MPPLRHWLRWHFSAIISLFYAISPFTLPVDAAIRIIFMRHTLLIYCRYHCLRAPPLPIRPLMLRHMLIISATRYYAIVFHLFRKMFSFFYFIHFSTPPSMLSDVFASLISAASFDYAHCCCAPAPMPLEIERCIIFSSAAIWLLFRRMMLPLTLIICRLIILWRCRHYAYWAAMLRYARCVIVATVSLRCSAMLPRRFIDAAVDAMARYSTCHAWAIRYAKKSAATRCYADATSLYTSPVTDYHYGHYQADAAQYWWVSLLIFHQYRQLMAMLSTPLCIFCQYFEGLIDWQSLFTPSLRRASWLFCSIVTITSHWSMPLLGFICHFPLSFCCCGTLLFIISLRHFHCRRPLSPSSR